MIRGIQLCLEIELYLHWGELQNKFFWGWSTKGDFAIRWIHQSTWVIFQDQTINLLPIACHMVLALTFPSKTNFYTIARFLPENLIQSLILLTLLGQEFHFKRDKHMISPPSPIQYFHPVDLVSFFCTYWFHSKFNNLAFQSVKKQAR